MVNKKRKNTPPKEHIMMALEEVAQRRGFNHSDLADACDVTKQAMHRRFEYSRNISVGAAAQMAEAMGYEMALVPKDSDYPHNSIRIAPILADKHRLGGRR